MEDYELKIAIQDQENKDSHHVGSFECHTDSLANAVALASNELGFLRVVQVVTDKEN